MKAGLTQSEFEELSAYLDGELDSQAADRAARRIELEPAWAQAFARLRAVDAALDGYSVPAPSGDLAERICANVRQAQATKARIVRWLAPLAAAAAIVLAVLAYQSLKSMSSPSAPSPVAVDPQQPIDEALAGLDQPDRFAVENMDFFRDYEVLENYDTLQAIDKLEQGEG